VTTKGFYILKFAVVLATLAATGGPVVADVKTPAPPSDTVLLFQKQGSALVRSLDVNLYGPGSHKHALEITGRGILFKPTDPADHLATPFLDLPFAFGQRRDLLIELALPGKDVKVDNLLIKIQREGFYDLATLTPDPAEAEPGAWSEAVPLPRLASKVRLLIVSANEQPAYIPSRIVIRCETPPFPQGLAWGGGLVALSGCVLVWVSRQHSAKVHRMV